MSVKARAGLPPILPMLQGILRQPGVAPSSRRLQQVVQLARKREKNFQCTRTWFGGTVDLPPLPSLGYSTLFFYPHHSETLLKHANMGREAAKLLKV